MINRAYGRLNGGELSYLSQPIKTGQGDLYTNDPGLLLAFGYKRIVRNAMLDIPDGYYPSQTITETDEELILGWELVADEVGEVSET